MNLATLKLFIVVARLGSFAEAARERAADPSSISRAIAELEHQVGARLFQRTTRKLVLSEAGTVFLGRVSGAVEEIENARDDAKAVTSGPGGMVRLTASHAIGTTCIAPLIPDLKARYPKLAFELILTDEVLDLVAHRIDLAVRLGPADDSSVHGTKLFNTRYRICVAPTYMERSGPLTAPDDLSQHRCLLFPFQGFRSQWRFIGQAGEQKMVPVDGDLITASALTLRTCAISGMGPTLLPHWLVDADIESGSLRRLFADYKVTATSFDTAAWLILPSSSAVPMKVRVVAQFLSERLASLGPASD